MVVSTCVYSGFSAEINFASSNVSATVQNSYTLATTGAISASSVEFHLYHLILRKGVQEQEEQEWIWFGQGRDKIRYSKKIGG